jgi:hypothetical protein
VFRLNAVKAFTVKIMSGEEKQCKVRFPTDAEWCERTRKVKVLRTNIGRDQYISDVTGQLDADAALLEKIRVDKDGVAFDPAEASRVITQLDSVRVESVERQGTSFQVILSVFGGETTVTLRCPTLRQSSEFEQRSMHFISGRRSQEWRSNLEPAGELFDALHISNAEYAGAIPITHKYATVREVLDRCEEVASEGIELPEEESPAVASETSSASA